MVTGLGYHFTGHLYTPFCLSMAVFGEAQKIYFATVFWWLSNLGSFLILIYAIFRRDPVLFIGHLMGISIYTRNIILLKKMMHNYKTLNTDKTIKWRFPAFLIFCAFSLLISVGTFGVIETSDARYAQISYEMFESKDYVNPTLLGIKHYHKPPLTYHITSIGYAIFGVTPFWGSFFYPISHSYSACFCLSAFYSTFWKQKGGYLGGSHLF
jgi:4-amino-4-deoxy-L-arabinose transferase and related glycosyltransferases of PMT family